MKTLKFSITLLSLILFSCTNSSEDDLTPEQELPSTVTYEAHVRSIIQNNCVSCHANPPVNGAGVPLETYSDVKTAVINNNLISKINGNGPGGLMPLGGPKLSQQQIDLITKWQQDGFPEK